MTLPEFSVKSHVMAFMMSAVLVLFGLIGYQDVGNDRFPDIDFPVISVVTPMPGADPETVDASVTRELERTVNTVPGIDDVESNSVPGVSTVFITFDLDTDIDAAFNEVQANVREAVDSLPEDAEDPIISKVEVDASPIMWLSLRGDRTLQQLSDYAENNVRRQLETISGVGDVLIGGGRDRNIRVELDVAALASERLTVQDLIDNFQMEHFQLPGGFLVSGQREEILKLDLEYDDPDQLGQMILDQRDDGRLVRLEDVAEIRDDLEDKRSLARFNGEPTVGIGVVKIAGTNTLEIIEEVEERLENQIEPQMPEGMEITISSDEGTFIRSMISNLERTLLIAVMLAGLVMWLFLKSLRSTLIIAASIPVSILAVIAVIYFFGYTLNSMTLLAILLLIGVVVDDAIVVLENVYRHREEGQENERQAAITGASQVFFAIIASSLSLVAIFGPVIFLEGVIGQFFESFAVVVVFGIAASTFVALTLIPMLCSRFLYVPKEHGRVYWILENAFRGLDRFYRNLLGLALRHRVLVLLLALAVVLPSFWAAGQLGGDFAPDEDEGQFVVNLRAPLGSNIHYTDRKLAEVESILESQEGVERYFAAIGLGDQGQVNEAISFVRLKDYAERDLSQQEIMAEVQEQLGEIPGVQGFASQPSIVPGQRGEPLQFYLQGPDLDEVAVNARELEDRLAGIDEMGSVDMDLRLDAPELDVDIDREQARLLGIPSFEVARAVNVLVGGLDVARYSDDFGGGERYDVRLKAREDQFTSIDDLERIQLRAGTGELVRLDQVADFEETLGPASVPRFNLQYGAQFFVDPEASLGEAIDILEDEAADMLPPGYSVEVIGEAREFERTALAILFVFAVAVILVYMVLGSQFNSFIQPIVVMLAMPLAIVGALLGLLITGQTLNIFSMIGMVLLIGVVTKNSILLIDMTNQYRGRWGYSVDEALRTACPIRLRPVLMTSLTLILAMVPAALDTGPGAEGNTSMGVAIIFGMIASTLLTLVVIPCAYSLVENRLARSEMPGGYEPDPETT